jgi:hypothetical protein
MSTDSDMPSRERADLLETLEKHRGFLRQTVAGITDEQAAMQPTASELCLGGLIKHVSQVEATWADFIVHGAAHQGPPDAAAMEAHANGFRMLPGETLESLLDEYERVATRTNELVASTPSLDDGHPLPAAPWFPPNTEWSARRVLVHIIAETAQHAGHADILRESIDGAKTMG